MVACVCGATRDGGDGGFFVQCSNPLCRVWQHGACVGFASEEEAEHADFFCDACRGLSTALRPAAAAAPALVAPLSSTAAGDDDDDDVPLGAPGCGGGGDAEQAARAAWRRSHNARKCAAVLQHALGADCAPQLVALLECSRPEHMRTALAGEQLGPVAARAGAARCLASLLRRSAASSASPPEVCGVPVGSPAACLFAALEAGRAPAAAAVLRECPALLAAACQPDFAASPTAGLPREQRSWNCLHAAAAGADLASLLLVVDRVPEHTRRMAAEADASGSTPLMLCAAASAGPAALDALGRPAAFLELLSPRCLPPGTHPVQHLQRADGDGLTAGHLAAGAGACAVLREISRVWDGFASALDHHHCTPMHLACAEGQAEAVQLLLSLPGGSALALARDQQGWTPLLYACGVVEAQHTAAHDAAIVAILSSFSPRPHFDTIRAFIESPREGDAQLARSLCRRMAENPALFSALNAFVAQNPDLLTSTGPFAFLLRRPGLLDLRNKRAWFSRQMALALRGWDDRGGAVHHPLIIHRERPWPSFAEWARAEGARSFRAPLFSSLRFALNGELMAGVGLGPEREFLSLLPQALVDAGLLAPTAEGSSLLAPVGSGGGAAPREEEDPRRAEFQALGWLLGYVCLFQESHQVAVPGLALSQATLRLLLGHREPSTASGAGWRAAQEDLEAQDPDLAQHLRGMLASQGTVQDWALTFEARPPPGGLLLLVPPWLALPPLPS